MGYLFPVLSPPADLIVSPSNGFSCLADHREVELGNLIYPFQTTDILRPKLFSQSGIILIRFSRKLLNVAFVTLPVFFSNEFSPRQ